VLFTEHSMDVVFSYAHKLLVLSGGTVIAEGDAASIRDNPEVQRVYFGSGNTFEDELGPRKGLE
jgi:ABC-type branched-subunit amino acid transport system ATPase component